MRGIDEAIRTVHTAPPASSDACVHTADEQSRGNPTVTVASGTDQNLDVSLEDWPSVAVSGT